MPPTVSDVPQSMYEAQQTTIALMIAASIVILSVLIVMAGMYTWYTRQHCAVTPCTSTESQQSSTQVQSHDNPLASPEPSQSVATAGPTESRSPQQQLQPQPEQQTAPTPSPASAAPVARSMLDESDQRLAATATTTTASAVLTAVGTRARPSNKMGQRTLDIVNTQELLRNASKAAATQRKEAQAQVSQADAHIAALGQYMLLIGCLVAAWSWLQSVPDTLVASFNASCAQMLLDASAVHSNQPLAVAWSWLAGGVIRSRLLVSSCTTLAVAGLVVGLALLTGLVSALFSKRAALLVLVVSPLALSTSNAADTAIRFTMFAPVALVCMGMLGTGWKQLLPRARAQLEIRRALGLHQEAIATSLKDSACLALSRLTWQWILLPMSCVGLGVALGIAAACGAGALNPSSPAYQTCEARKQAIAAAWHLLTRAAAVWYGAPPSEADSLGSDTFIATGLAPVQEL